MYFTVRKRRMASTAHLINGSAVAARVKKDNYDFRYNPAVV